MCIYVYIQNEMWKIGTEIHLAELNGVFGPELKKKKVNRNMDVSCIDKRVFGTFVCHLHCVTLDIFQHFVTCLLKYYSQKCCFIKLM